MYALYKGEELIASGSIFEIAQKTGLKIRTIKFYGTPSYKKRASASGFNNYKILIKI